ncbi:MAG: hypothetical protein HY914_01280 [Desulfomonile tiedjei]|nr:hypothetical protein [Desulfomonile tiedjei]
MDDQLDGKPIALPNDVGLFRPEDAPGIARLFRTVYGEEYPVKLFYDPEALTQANANGDYYSIVARTAAAEVIGVVHAFRSTPYKALYELGAGLVLPDYRGLGVNKRMFSFVFEEWAPKVDGIEETFGEAVCNHVHNQKEMVLHKHVETALEVALMPARAYAKEQSSSGRVAALLGFRSYRPKPHTVFLPAAYEPELRHIYERLDDRRELHVSDATLPHDVVSAADMTVFDFARVARIAVHHTGVDFGTFLHNLETEAVNENTAVFQVWLTLTDPWVSRAVDILRNRGYFFGGLLPRWFDGDGFLMQKLVCDPDFEGIRLYSEAAREFLEIVRNDWRRAQG